MTQSFIQPKGTLPLQTNIGDLQNQYAQLFANQQLQNQAQQQAAETDPLRQTVNDLVKSKLMQQIEMPQFTTIQDIFKAPKGEKLETFGKYLNTPSGQNLIGGVLGLLTGGNLLGSPQDDYTNYLYADMGRRQSQAMQQMREQNDLAQAMANAYNQKDIHEADNKMRKELAEQELAWKREEANLDRALKREQMAQSERLARIIHGGGGSATGGAANINDLKMTAAERKSLTEGKTTLANIESGLKALEANPKAYTFAKGLLPADVTNRLDPKGVATRTQIDNITAVYRKWLTGAQMSDKERKAYERFLPAPTDNYEIVKSKLENMKGAIERSNDAILSNYGVSSQSMNNTQSKDSLGLGI